MPDDIKTINLAIFDVAFNIIGGGNDGNKQHVKTKEEADHSLPYMIAVALLDGEVTPAQYDAKRILKQDVQDLLKKVTITPDKAMSDGAQSLDMPQFQAMMRSLGPYIDLWKESRMTETAAAV